MLYNYTIMSSEAQSVQSENRQGFNTNIWLDESQRPREYAGLDWVTARSLLQPVLELAEPKPTDVMVDIGTGTGAILLYLAPYVGTAVGVDYSEAMLKQVDSSASPNVKLLRADARDATPLASHSADIVTTRMMLHDLADPEGATREAWRIVKPGGKFIATEFVVDMPEPQAIQLTDSFESGSVHSSLLPPEFFCQPSKELMQLHRQLFTLKNEPTRHLWEGKEFRDLIARVLCEGASAVELYFSVTPFNSVANWLGKSGFGLEVKQLGLVMCIGADDEVKEEQGLVVTVDGSPIELRDHLNLLEEYSGADTVTRETMNVDVKINRAFANVVASKSS